MSDKKVRFAQETEMATFKHPQIKVSKLKISMPTDTASQKIKRLEYRPLLEKKIFFLASKGHHGTADTCFALLGAHQYSLPTSLMDGLGATVIGIQDCIDELGTLDPLEDLVQCALCMDRLTVPKMLLCQHTFCLNCLQFHLSPGVTEAQCPTCKQCTPLEKGLDSLEHLPGNLYIDSILKVVSGSGPPRTPTSQGPETRCIKCQTLCQFHEHACQHCKQLFCGICWSGHINELQEQLNSLHEQLTESHCRLDHRVDAFKDRCSQLEENIRNATEHKIKELKKKEKMCLAEAEQIKDNGKKSSEVLRARVKELEKMINPKEFGKIADNNQKVTKYMALHRNTSALLDEVSRWGDTRTIFDANSFKIDSDADASIDAEADDEEGIANNSVCARNPLENQDSLLMHYKNKIFTPKLTWTKCLRPAGVGIAPWNNNCIYVAGSDSRHIYGIDKQKGKLLFRITAPLMLCPVGLTFSQTRQEMFVSDKWKHCIHVFDKTGNYLKSLGKKGDGPGQFTSPEGLAIAANDRLFICDTGNDRIQVLHASDGRFLYAFGIIGEGFSISNTGIVMDLKYAELNIPTGIAIHDNKVIIADSGNRRIKIYTLEGEKLNEFGTLGKNKGQFRTPEVVAVDPLGFIIVGDSGNARIQIFRPNGSLVRVFRNKGKFSWISGLHITPQLDMIITDYKNHTVQVF